MEEPKLAALDEYLFMEYGLKVNIQGLSIPIHILMMKHYKFHI